MKRVGEAVHCPCSCSRRQRGLLPGGRRTPGTLANMFNRGVIVDRCFNPGALQPLRSEGRPQPGRRLGRTHSPRRAFDAEVDTDFVSSTNENKEPRSRYGTYCSVRKATEGHLKVVSTWQSLCRRMSRLSREMESRLRFQNCCSGSAIICDRPP